MLLSWLRERYNEFLLAEMYEDAARVYMLYLVVCTVLADKSHNYIDVRYVWLFCDLNHANWA